MNENRNKNKNKNVNKNMNNKELFLPSIVLVEPFRDNVDDHLDSEVDHESGTDRVEESRDGIVLLSCVVVGSLRRRFYFFISKICV